jgi:hypothetical protein
VLTTVDITWLIVSFAGGAIACDAISFQSATWPRPRFGSGAEPFGTGICWCGKWSSRRASQPGVADYPVCLLWARSSQIDRLFPGSLHQGHPLSEFRTNTQHNANMYYVTIVPHTIRGGGLMMPMWQSPLALTRSEKPEISGKPSVLN